MQLTKILKIDATAGHVWNLFAHRFDDGADWMASVPRSVSNGDPPRFDGATTAGQICDLRPDGTGMKASEYFVAYDEAARTELAEEFRHFAETGTPHPRKVAAIQKIAAEGTGPSVSAD